MPPIFQKLKMEVEKNAEKMSVLFFQKQCALFPWWQVIGRPEATDKSPMLILSTKHKTKTLQMQQLRIKSGLCVAPLGYKFLNVCVLFLIRASGLPM